MRSLRTRSLLAVCLTMTVLASASPAAAKQPPATRCVAAADDAHDEEPPAEAVGFDTGSLDVLGLRMNADSQLLRVVVTVRSLSQPIQPPGQNLSYRVFWTSQPPEQPEYRFSLDAQLDAQSASFTIGQAAVDTRTRNTGDSFVQIGGPLHGTVDPQRRTVTMDVPRSLLAPYTQGPGKRLTDIAFSSWHGLGNPAITVGDQVLVGSSGYRRLTDTQVTGRTLDLGATTCGR